ncbi:MAG TPA: WecB/TagA/CpsF family glycosyltransferase [Tepidisphaeraceae bacterium]|nr:WecB/TagA/CpsF family glycosyltransferase [Tepidisphaeraceae bacterium]
MYLRYEPSWEASESTGKRAPRRNGARSGAVAQRANVAVGALPDKVLPKVDILGVMVHAITEADCIDHILTQMERGRGGVVVTPNLDHLRRYLSDVNFGALVAEADLVVADGMPLVWASRLQGTPLPERVAGSNLISSLSSAAANRKRSIFLLGGSPHTAEGAARVLGERCPSLKIAGWHFPAVGFENDPPQMAAIIAMLSTAKPDIIYVALGSPKQERLIAKLRQILPNAWWLGVGNSFSFLCGDVKRAPQWMQVTGLEWVHRLSQEPRRLFKRYVMVGVPFATTLLARSAARGIPNRLRQHLWAGAAEILPESPATPRATPVSSPGILAQGALSLPAALELPDSAGPWISSASTIEHTGGRPLSRLRALILLGGSVRINALSAAACRSVLDFPLDEGGSILNFWLAQAAEVARTSGLEKLPVRVMVNQNSPEPGSPDARFMGCWRVERDLSEYRGTGGVLRDIAKDYEDDDLILVANAAQILLDPLPVIVSALDRKRGDVTVISHDDGTPSGIQLVTCKTLRLLGATGFVDMKEQGLPLIASQFDVRVVKRRRPTGLPVRSLEGYIQALHYYHRRRSGKPAITDPLAEDWSPVFSLVEAGATVSPLARVHDSVVLAGGRVEEGAVLVRSMVCPGAVVRRDHTAVDQIITGDPDARRAFRRAGVSVVSD